ncbi:hypothetical protein VQL36_12150 [Chengkuizengella sp. SCS-71B]|uniref:hypothetical protein n=1 Tax=Chengkuizengella sp. SCS-71B TaxID=3115290 RepID=UPI0032C21480
MIGTWKWNLVFSLTGMILTFVFNVFNNLIQTSIVRSLICFLLLFTLGFVVRWGIAVILKNNLDQSPVKGSYLDLTTPEEIEEMNEAIKENVHSQKGQNTFTPMEPPKLQTNDKLDSKAVAEAVKHLSNE